MPVCQIRSIAKDILNQVRPRQHIPPLKVAIGLAVPSIEAWLLCGINPHVSEAAWINGVREGRLPYTKDSLKAEVYGTSHPSLLIETEAMRQARVSVLPWRYRYSSACFLTASVPCFGI